VRANPTESGHRELSSSFLLTTSKSPIDLPSGVGIFFSVFSHFLTNAEFYMKKIPQTHLKFLEQNKVQVYTFKENVQTLVVAE